MTKLFDLTGRIALITGSGQGLGLALAEETLLRGAAGGAPEARACSWSGALPALLPGKVFNVRVTGVAGQSYTLQFATIGTNWTDILTTNAPGNVFYLTDNQATNISRLYRLRVNP